MLDAIKAFALLWICLIHWTQQLFGGWDIANPDNFWPPLADRVAQLMPVSGHGIWDIPLSLLLDFGRAGDQGVQLFLIVSGFGLTWALPQSKGGATPGWGGFYRRRLSRIYPEYWMAHLMVLAGVLAGALAPGRALQSSFLFSLLGIRVTPPPALQPLAVVVVHRPDPSTVRRLPASVEPPAAARLGPVSARHAQRFARDPDDRPLGVRRHRAGVGLSRRLGARRGLRHQTPGIRLRHGARGLGTKLAGELDGALEVGAAC